MGRGALSPQEAMRITSARLIWRAEVVLVKRCCGDAELLSLVSQIFTVATGPLPPSRPGRVMFMFGR